MSSLPPLSPSPQFPNRCNAFTVRGTRCRIYTAGDLCELHDLDARLPNQCVAYTKRGERCVNYTATDLCSMHDPDGVYAMQHPRYREKLLTGTRGLPPHPTKHCVTCTCQAVEAELPNCQFLPSRGDARSTGDG